MRLLFLKASTHLGLLKFETDTDNTLKEIFSTAKDFVSNTSWVIEDSGNIIESIYIRNKKKDLIVETNSSVIVTDERKGSEGGNIYSFKLDQNPKPN